MSDSSKNPDTGPGGVNYRDLLDRIDRGFCIIEMLFDENERPVDYRFLEVNAAFESQTGIRDATGKTMRSFEPDHEEHWFELYGRIALTGEPAAFDRPAEKLGRHFEVNAFRVGQPHQRRVAILFSDITDRKREQERLALISAEVEHRTRNLFQVISAIVRRTQADTVEELRLKLSERIGSLVGSHQLLSKGQAVGLAELIGQEMEFLKSEEDGRVAWQGPVARLQHAAAQLIALTLHELATNAMKYGALSRAEGRLDLSWTWRDDGRLELLWVESGGPEVLAPRSRGTGTAVLTGAIERQLGGKVDFEWRREGLRCTIIVPAEAVSG